MHLIEPLPLIIVIQISKENSVEIIESLCIPFIATTRIFMLVLGFSSILISLSGNLKTKLGTKRNFTEKFSLCN